MKGRLIVENFGPIKKVDIQLNKLMVFIGPQSSGKSTIAKLIAILTDAEFVIKAFQNETISQFIKEILNYGMNDYFNPNSRIAFHTNFYNLTIKDDTYQLQLNSEYYQLRQIIEEDKVLLNYKFNKLGVGMEFDLDHVNPKALSYSVKYLPGSIYIPAERILYSTLSESLFSLLSNKINLPQFFLKFGSHIEQARSGNAQYLIKPLGITYSRENNQDWVIHNNGDKLKLSHASSGIQANLPLFIVVEGEHSTEYLKSFIIEEPELNLYPTTQKELVKFLADKCIDDKNNLLLTTHSPYVLAALSNLIKGNEVAKLSDNKKGKVDEVVPQNYWIDFDDTSAYFIDAGEANDIMDKELKTIDFTQIDHASDIIGDEFDRLLEIEIED